MAQTVNFTGSVDRDLLKRAKILAAKSDTSVNVLFNAELRYLVETFEAAEASNNQDFRSLLDFSFGRNDARTTRHTLGLDSEEDLFLLMAQAHLPMPQLSLGEDRTGVFLFEDHGIAKANFLLPDTCRKVSTRAFLLFFEHNKMIPSAAAVERTAVLAGRQFSQIRFPPD